MEAWCRRCLSGVLGGASLVLSMQVRAEETEQEGWLGSQPLNWALLSGFESKHVGHHPNLNGHNAGIGVRFPQGWALGTFNNSFNARSVYAGRELQWQLAGDADAGLRAGFVAGVVSGYRGGLNGGRRHGLHVLALPELVLQFGPAEAALFYVPDGAKSPATWSAQLRLRWR